MAEENEIVETSPLPDYKPSLSISFKKCKCGREFLVQNFLCGSNHTIGLFVICKECLNDIGVEFEKAYPEQAKRIREWLNKNG